MNYIKAMEIINFQSHKHTVLNFENGLNVIVGQSDCGKSAIIRALKWVLYNEPKGNDFITQGENSCRVSITLSDDTTIVREKKSSKNIYRLIKADGTENVYEGFGGDIPPQIAQAHNIIKMQLDSSLSQSINIAEQLETPFLLSEPGSVKAKAIGKLVGVDIIDEASKDVTRDIALIQNEEKRIDKDIADTDEKLEHYDKLDDLRKYIEQKEQLIAKLKKLNLEYNTLIKLQTAYNKALNDIEVQKDVIMKTRNVEKATNTLNNVISQKENLLSLVMARKKYLYLLNEIRLTQNTSKELKEIDTAIKNYEVVEKQCAIMSNLIRFSNNLSLSNKSIKKGVKYLEGFKDLDKSQKIFDSLLEKKLCYNRLKDLKSSFSNNQKLINDTKYQLLSFNKEIDILVNEYTSFLKKLGRCPVCMSPIQEHTLEHIIDEFKGGKPNGRV